MKRFNVFVSFLLMGVLLAPMVMGQGKAEGEPIKIGALFAVSGGAAWLGEPERNTAMMIVEEINAQGGIDGRPIELIVEDTEGDNTKAALATKKLISREKVTAIVGPSRSGTTMAVVPIVQEAEVPLISCAAAAAIVEPVEERKWVFKTPQMDSDAVIRIYEHMQSKGINKIAIITGTTGFGTAGREQLKKLAGQMGITIVADETYSPADTDMTAQLTKIKASDAQALVNWSIVPAQSIVPKNMHQLGMDIQLYQSHGFGNIKYAEAAGNAAEGIIFPAGPLLAVESLPADHPQKKVLTEYTQDYKERFGESASTFGGHAYDAMHLVVRAIKKGGATREGIRKGLEQVDGYVGTAGIFNLSPTNHVGLDKHAFEMLTVKDGKFVLLKEEKGKACE
jgi:branched-chain amino acid transport system substrate-binding protein